MERSEFQKELLRAQFSIWDQIVELKGKDNTDPGSTEIKEYTAEFGRRDEAESLFEQDKIYLAQLNLHLEDYRSVSEDFTSSSEDERWLEIRVRPKDPYRPIFGQHVFSMHPTGNLETKHYVNCLTIYLSSEGRAYENTSWTYYMDQGYSKYSTYPTIRKMPPEAEIHELSEDEADSFEMESSSGLEPLSSQNIERLRFLQIQAQAGNLIESK